MGNQDLSKTSNVTFSNITASGDVVISGDLTVLGNATEIQTSELRIEDKLITIASGSTNSAEADGSGIEIDGAGKSLIWDDATQSFILNAKVSSSVGFKGDGSEEREYVHGRDAAKLSVDILSDKKFSQQSVILTGIERFKYSQLLLFIKEIILS